MKFDKEEKWTVITVVCGVLAFGCMWVALPLTVLFFLLMLGAGAKASA